MKRENDKRNPGQYQAVLIRHAQSQWNLENRFTGWADPPLTQEGIHEAGQAAQDLHTAGLHFDVAYSSRLQRAISTLDILLDKLGQPSCPRYEDWRLNERHYGKLQGADKGKAIVEVGEQQVWRWRRGYEDLAEPLSVDDHSHPRHDPKYADIDPIHLPCVENLAQTRKRVSVFWYERIAPHLRQNERVLISAHGNTLRALLMELSGMSVEQVEDFEIPTATPILCRFTDNGVLIEWTYLTSDNEQLRSA